MRSPVIARDILITIPAEKCVSWRKATADSCRGSAGVCLPTTLSSETTLTGDMLAGELPVEPGDITHRHLSVTLTCHFSITSHSLRETMIGGQRTTVRAGGPTGGWSTLLLEWSCCLQKSAYFPRLARQPWLAWLANCWGWRESSSPPPPPPSPAPRGRLTAIRA